MWSVKQACSFRHSNGSPLSRTWTIYSWCVLFEALTNRANFTAFVYMSLSGIVRNSYLPCFVKLIRRACCLLNHLMKPLAVQIKGCYRCGNFLTLHFEHRLSFFPNVPLHDCRTCCLILLVFLENIKLSSLNLRGWPI